MKFSGELFLLQTQNVHILDTLLYWHLRICSELFLNLDDTEYDTPNGIPKQVNSLLASAGRTTQR